MPEPDGSCQGSTIDDARVRPGRPACACGQRTAAVLRLLIVAAIATLLVMAALDHLPEWLAQRREDNAAALLVACVLYALLLALPFVPSVEIGLLIMVVFGKWGAVGAYLATVAGLSLAYGVARAVAREGGSHRLRLPRPLDDRVHRLARNLPTQTVPVVALALLLNLPGNTAVGGGGGIALLYGASRSLSWPRFTVTVIVATSALPILFFVGIL